MKIFFSTLLALASAIPVFANFNGAGYYRIKNQFTLRYVTVIDNDCEYIDLVTGKIDGHSLFTIQDFDIVCHDPASVIYAKKTSGTQYEVSAQGVSVKDMMKYHLNLGEWGKLGNEILYRLYATDKGVTKYLGDSANSRYPTGTVIFGTPVASSTNSQKVVNWMILPISSNGDNFFGVLPTVTASGMEWASLYASFPYSAVSPGVEFYYPCAIASTGIVEMKKISGAVQGGVPVIVKCPSADPAQNRLNVGASGGKKPTDNILKGRYFNCYVSNGKYVNRLAYDKSTMRVLGRCADGSVGFVTDETLKYIPANSAYLVVPAWYPKELKCVFTHAEFEAGVGEITADEEGGRPVDVYSITGVKVLKEATEEEIARLPKGLYIVGGKKRMVR